MHGPAILVRSLSAPRVPDQFGNVWQYHSRSDRHSKIGCWAILFDLLLYCPLLAQHARVGKVGFGINHEMRDFKTGRKKNLDLVLCTPGNVPRKPKKSAPDTFRELVKKYGVELTDDQRQISDSLPDVLHVSVGSVHLALEAKATMTAHIAALPRLHDELNSSHLAIHGSSDFAIAAGFTMVNLATTFMSSNRNEFDMSVHPARITKHNQPRDTERTIAKIREIPRRTAQNTEGFDAMGIVVLKMVNDKSPVELMEEPPAPATNEIFHYDSMIRRIAALYEGRFSSI